MNNSINSHKEDKIKSDNSIIKLNDKSKLSITTINSYAPTNAN